MGKQTSLTVAGIDSRIKKALPKLYSDAGARGLYLKTTTAGTGSWIFRWRDRATNKLRDMGLGSTTEITLAEARDLARDLHRQVRDGGDPIAERHRKRQERIAEQAKAQTFRQVAQAFYAARIEATGYSEKHKKRWQSTMTMHVYPKIGAMLVKDVELAHVESVLAPIWADHLDMARKIRQNLEKIIGYAIAGGLHPGPNPAVWRGVLDTRLADTTGIRKAKPVQHHKALPFAEINPFIVDLRSRDGIAARAVEFLIYTWARSGEVRRVEWADIDLEAKVWTVPASKSKNGKAHRVPLSEPAVKLLKALPRHKDSTFVFWAPRGGALSDMALTAVLRRMEVSATIHGFRSTGKDWARSRTSYADEVSELALGHVNSDSTRAAYARDELIEARTRLMRDWAKFIDSKPVKAATVTAINAKSA
ncbi:MAG: integrase arm-type DNA-binding domain-containing protein [Pseudomonadales bacterium]